MIFSKPKKTIGLDVGTYSVKAIQMSRSGGRLCVDQVGVGKVDPNLLNADPNTAHANAMNDALAGMMLNQSLTCAALPGQTVVIRYPRLNDVPRESMESAIEKEAGQSIPYDLNEVFLDWSLLDESETEEQRQLKILLVAAKHEVIDTRMQIFDAANVQCGVLSVDSLALADAAEAADFLRVGETVAIINIGLSSTSVHFIKDGVSNFIRDISWGTRELLQVVSREKACDIQEADRMLQDLLVEQPEAATPPDLPPDMPVESAQDEAMGEIPSADPFGEMGGGSLLDPLDEELGAADTAGLASSSAGGGMGKDGRSVGEIIMPPMGRLVSEVRRSFDFYEHQLYERPVDRIILSGGIAELPQMRSALQDEMGVDTVEVANPLRSALFMGDDFAVAPLKENPAQFMVALGLAARGMADL